MTEIHDDDDDDDESLSGYVNVDDFSITSNTSVLLDKINATIPKRRQSLKRDTFSHFCFVTHSYH